MKRLLAALAMILTATGVFTGMAYAAHQSVQGTTNRTVYKVADTITIEGTVNGDVFCAGQTVNINATVNGDILCAGQTITVEGTVNGNVRLVGQTVNLAATVTGSASIAGQDVSLERTASVGRDASLAGQTVTLSGKIGRDLSGGVNNLVINNSVGRNVLLQTNQLTLDNRARIGGNLSYTSPNTLHKNGGAVVVGKTTYHKGQVERHGFNGVFWAWRFYWWVALIVLAVVLAALFPQLFRRWHPGGGAGLWWALLTGFIAMFVVPVAIFVLFITIIGAPLGLILLLLWLAAGLLSMALASYFVGSVISRNKLHPVLMALIGAVILGGLMAIPKVGSIFAILAYWLGIGMLLIGLKRSYHRPTYATIEDKK